MGYTLNFSVVWRNFDNLLWGLGLSLVLAFAAIAIGCAIGLATAFARTSRQAVLRALSGAYVTIFRNTPLLVLVLFSFFALPQLGLRLQLPLHDDKSLLRGGYAEVRRAARASASIS